MALDAGRLGELRGRLPAISNGSAAGSSSGFEAGVVASGHPRRGHTAIGPTARRMVAWPTSSSAPSDRDPRGRARRLRGRARRRAARRRGHPGRARGRRRIGGADRRRARRRRSSRPRRRPTPSGRPPTWACSSSRATTPAARAARGRRQPRAPSTSACCGLARQQSEDMKAQLMKAGVRIIRARAGSTAPTPHRLDRQGQEGTDFDRIEADTLVVSVGASPRILPTAMPDGERILTWTQLYTSTRCPSTSSWSDRVSRAPSSPPPTWPSARRSRSSRAATRCCRARTPTRQTSSRTSSSATA